MKRVTALLAFSLLMLCTSAQVQRKALAEADSGSVIINENKRTPKEPGIRKNNRKSFKELNLTSDQKRKMREIQLANRSKKEVVLNNSSLTEDQKKGKLREIQKEGLDNLRQLLSDEQMEKLKVLRSKRKISDKDIDL